MMALLKNYELSTNISRETEMLKFASICEMEEWISQKIQMARVYKNISQQLCCKKLRNICSMISNDCIGIKNKFVDVAGFNEDSDKVMLFEDFQIFLFLSKIEAQLLDDEITVHPEFCFTFFVEVHSETILWETTSHLFSKKNTSKYVEMIGDFPFSFYLYW